MFTGIKPININENGIRMSLKNKIDEAKEVLEKIGNNETNSFIAGTGHKFIKGITNWHCYTLENVNNANKTAKIFDNRYQEEITLSFNDFIKKIKYITGYFNEDLK